jgi:two-component sensor histidine kinase
VSYEVEDVAVSVDVAVPLGLAVTELLTNAFKYGVRRPEPAPCGARTGDADLVVTLRGPTENLEIAVIDSGPGLAMDARWDNSLGLRLVRSLAEQIYARVEYDHAGGSRFAIIRRAGPVSAEGAAQPR